jgi:hypothetical protein
MAVLFCEHCKRDTKFLPIRNTIQIAGVSRSTVYYWMDHAWVHWRVLASGRRVICQESVSRRCPPESETAEASQRSIRPKVSDSVQSGKLIQE